jgi:hypothetical protein
LHPVLAVLRSLSKQVNFVSLEPLSIEALSDMVADILDRPSVEVLPLASVTKSKTDVIPFSGAPLAADASLEAHTVFATYPIAGTDRVLRQPAKILPVDPTVRSAILEIEAEFEEWLRFLQDQVAHLPSRVRSLVWITSAAQVLPDYGAEVPPQAAVIDQLLLRLPGLGPLGETRVRRFAWRSDPTHEIGSRMQAVRIAV